MKTQRLITIVIMCVLSTMSAFATTIKGKLFSLENQVVNIYAFSNYFTKNTYLITQSKTDNAGNLLAEFTLEEPQLILVESKEKLLEFYAMPQGSYEIGLEKEKLVWISESNSRINSTLKQVDKDFFVWFSSFMNLETGALKDSTLSFSKVISDFEEIRKRYAYGKEPYLAELIKFKFADRELNFCNMSFLFKNTDTRDLYEKFEIKYFDSTPPNLKNPFYIDLITNYLEMRVSTTSLLHEDYGNVRTIDRLLKEASYLKQSNLKDLAKVACVKIVYSNNWYEDKSTFNKVADSIKNAISDKKHQIILQEVIAANNLFKVGDMFPEYMLKDHFGKSVSTRAIKDKYVLVDFWFTGCYGCITEMKNFPSLIDKYKDLLAFVSISADENFEKMHAVTITLH